MKYSRIPGERVVQRELLLVGGGHAHVAVLRRFGMKPLPGVRVTMLSRDVHTPYSGMLPGLVAGHYTHADCHIDLARLCAATGARFVHGSLTAIDMQHGTVEVQDRGGLGWDLLSLNTGSRPALDSIPGAAEHGVAVKPIDRFVGVWEKTEAMIAAGQGPRHIVVVGGGAAAVEIALAIAWRLQQNVTAGTEARIVLACAGARILEGHTARVRRSLEARLAGSGIGILCGARVASAHIDALALADGRRIACDLPVWAIHAAAPSWPRDAGLACDEAGFVRVEQSLRSVSHERVFAAGDIASLPERVAKSGVYAVREGEVLADNLGRALRNEPLLPYHPQRRFLSLIATGGKHAVASRGHFFAAGRWVWQWKDRIDRRFMSMYRVTPVAPEVLSAPEGMRCGGCAAKVDAQTLSAVLAGLGGSTSGDLLHGIDSAEDAAVIAPPPGQVLVQSVDYFRAFVEDPWLLGRIATVHALGDLHAMGAKPHSALAIATVPHAAAHIVRDTLGQLMDGARSALLADGVILAGGHSSEGAELGFGLNVNGFAPRESLLLKSGLRDGQALILTKALGTGVLFAANMAGAADGHWISEALRVMQQGHAAAIAILRRHGIGACTDVTGFGLLGHLGEMLRASGMGAELAAAALPTLPGARECLAAGYRSSLHTANAAALSHIDGIDRLDLTEQALLVDPQTAGGLLAAVPAAAAEECVAELVAGGYQAAVIGRVSAAIARGRISAC